MTEMAGIETCCEYGEEEISDLRELVELLVWGSESGGTYVFDNPRLQELWLKLGIVTPEWSRDRMCGYAYAEWLKLQDAKNIQDALPGLEKHQLRDLIVMQGPERRV